MNDALIISNLLLWMLVLALGLVVVALTRQIGLLHERIAPAGALSGKQGPQVGEPAPRFELAALSGRGVSIGPGERTLLFFMSPSCPVCATLLPTLRRVGAEESVRIVLASDGDVDEHRAYVREKRLEGVDYVLSTELGLGFGVARLPTAVLIDEDGIVRGHGIVNTREHLESLFAAEELGVGSVQEHVERLRVVS